MSNSSTPSVVSVILVNYKGAEDTISAVRHLRDLDWPQSGLEIVVVENASGDGSAERIAEACPEVVLVRSPQNLGFAGGCNLGVRHSRGDVVAFLNNDARPDRAWVRTAVDRLASNARIGAIASRVLDWDGERVDYIGSGLTWYGMGYKPHTGDPVPKVEPSVQDVLFGTGAAMFVRRSVFDELGGFDERYFMFFEDVDLGWRLNLAGYRFVYEPASIAFHKHHASMKSFGQYREQYLLERNALFTLYKNLGDEALADALPAAMALAMRRSVVKAGADSEALDLRRAIPDEQQTEPIPKDLLAGVFAVDQFVDKLPTLQASREAIQRSRVVSDARLWELFGSTDVPALQDQRYLDGYQAIWDAFKVAGTPVITHVLVITGDPIGAKMAGPAIRAWSMAEALAESHAVTLVSLAGVEPGISAPFKLAHVRPGDDRGMRGFEREADVIVFQGLAMALFDSIRKSSKIIVADIYDPIHLEQLEQGRELGAEQWKRQVGDATDVLNEQLLRGDFFLCASERQRQFYLGQLAALGRVNPSNYEDDPDLEKLISVVPFGLASTPPRHERSVLKGVLPDIGADDKVLLWSGGLYNWFDPKSLIRAVAQLSAEHPEVKLFFQGTKHPHPGVPEMAIVQESRALARQLGVLDTNVFFNPSWVDYADRQNYLTEADAGVSTHFAHIETTFSFRTRILDYLWAGLPMVVTEGDHFADLVSSESLGVVVPSGDVAALAGALEKVLFDRTFSARARRNIARVRKSYEWSSVLAPLLAFMEQPRHAADLAERGLVAASDRGGFIRPPRKSGIKHDLGLVLHYARNGGPQVVISKISTRLRRRR